MKISDPAAGHPRLWQRVGVALMAAGVVLGVAAYLISHRTNLLSPGDGALDASSATVASSGRADS